MKARSLSKIPGLLRKALSFADLLKAKEDQPSHEETRRNTDWFLKFKCEALLPTDIMAVPSSPGFVAKKLSWST